MTRQLLHHLFLLIESRMHVFLTLTCIKVYLGTVSTKLGANSWICCFWSRARHSSYYSKFIAYTECFILRDRSQCHRMHHSNGFNSAAAAKEPGQKRNTAKTPEFIIPVVRPARNSAVLFCQHKATLPSYASLRAHRTPARPSPST